jgi:hypothetical protein
MPARENIPDNAHYCIKIDEQTVGKYCRNCGRFTYGASQHYTNEHKGTSTFPYKGAAPVPPVPPATDQTAAVAAIIAPPPTVGWSMMAALPPAPVPPPVTSAGIDLNSVPQISKDALINRQTNYDLGGKLGGTRDPFLAQALEDDDDTHFMALLGKGYDR